MSCCPTHAITLAITFRVLPSNCIWSFAKTPVVWTEFPPCRVNDRTLLTLVLFHLHQLATFQPYVFFTFSPPYYRRLPELLGAVSDIRETFWTPKSSPVRSRGPHERVHDRSVESKVSKRLDYGVQSIKRLEIHRHRATSSYVYGNTRGNNNIIYLYNLTNF